MAIGLSTGVSLDAKQKTPKASPTIHVLPLDEDFDAKALKRPGVKVHPAPPSEETAGEWTVPDRKQREQWLKDSGVVSEIGDWDEMDRDLLVIRAREYPIDRLTELYPGLPKEKLAKLKSALVPR